MTGIRSLATVGIFVAFACSAAAAQPGAEPPPGPIQAMLAQGPFSPLDAFQIDKGPVARFYNLRSYQPAWAEAGQQQAAQLAIEALSNAFTEGLNPADYHLADLAALARSRDKNAGTEYDILLSASLLHYETDVRLGRIPARSVDSDVALPVAAFDAAAETQAALAQGRLAQFLAQLPPRHLEYLHLKQALATYRTIEESGGWQAIPDISVVDLDAEDARIPALRARLAAEHFLQSSGGWDDPQNTALREAIQRYQDENGLAADGKAGRQTLAALNVPVGDRISQIIANMERWRWVPRDLGSRYIEVNAADASLAAVQNGKVVLRSRVIVGKPATRTPILSATVTGVTVNPFWNVPAPIARHEIFPKVRKDPGYLANHNMFIDSSGQLRQMPGPDNSLGLVKLELPNRFNVYLHDTPAKTLFAQDRRYFSHGCIRVEQIRALASFAMTNDPSAGLDSLESDIAAGVNKTILLDNPLPVYVLYWTAIANQDGRAGFRSDVYGRDQRLLAALAGQHLIGRTAMITVSGCASSTG